VKRKGFQNEIEHHSLWWGGNESIFDKNTKLKYGDIWWFMPNSKDTYIVNVLILVVLPFRPDLMDNYLALVLSAFISSGLLEVRRDQENRR